MIIIVYDSVDRDIIFREGDRGGESFEDRKRLRRRRIYLKIVHPQRGGNVGEKILYF